MEVNTKPIITVSTSIQAPIEKVWLCWTNSEHITGWYFASDDWHAPSAVNDLSVGGSFSTRMEAKDGSFGFDFGGTYTEISSHQSIAYTMADGRRAEITFTTDGATTAVVETFEAESENPVTLQQHGWQMILNNFKKYCEAS